MSRGDEWQNERCKNEKKKNDFKVLEIYNKMDSASKY